MGAWNPQKAHEWYLKNRERIQKQHGEYYRKHRAEVAERGKQRQLRSPFYFRDEYLKLKLQAMQIVSGQEKPVCVYCGCDDIRFLEVNHKNGGGSKEIRDKRKMKGGPGHNLYWEIFKGRRKVEDLEVTCGPHNRWYYYKLLYGDDATRFQISWK